MILLSKKIWWMILSSLFIFDNVVSYWAIKYMYAKEANMLIAPLVEKYPILYFPIIPLTVVIMLIIVKIVLIIAKIIFKKWVKNEEILERIILGAVVVYWAIGNSSANMIFLLGYRIQGIWLKTTLIALLATLIYVIFILFQVSRLKNIE